VRASRAGIKNQELIIEKRERSECPWFRGGMQSMLFVMVALLCHRLLLIASLLLVCGMWSHASATDHVVIKSGPQRVSLIELYTSEGCSSCPPAEQWLSALRKDARLWRTIVPVAFHVDYWDRLGWKDRFAQPSFTARQYAYAQAGTVYTPGFVVDGREWRTWFEDQRLPSNNESAGMLEALVSSAGAITARYSPEMKFEEGTGHVAWLGFSLVSDVRRGENAGRALHHDFVVLEHASAKLSRDVEGHWTARLDTPRLTDKTGALAVWVEAKGIPVQAAGGWLDARQD